ncbi:MAG: hypothetical protein ACLRM4_06975 [Anaerostipes sp.]|uniref:hypothetical protein n=1 Tax=Anaerostipes sp. TaxID=1872530 RepID=UPI0039A0297B
MNVDIWNYIHFIIPGAMAYALRGIAVGVSNIGSSVFLIIADCCKMAGIFRLEGTTCSTLSYIGTTFPLPLFNKILIKFQIK